MGLSASHGAFHGTCAEFNRLRQEVAYAIGGSYPPHLLRSITGHVVYKNGFAIIDDSLDSKMWYWGDGYTRGTHPGLYEFLCHSDCDGQILPEMCAIVADELEKLLPKIRDGDDERKKMIKKFIAGCREAARNGELLEFY